MISPGRHSPGVASPVGSQPDGGVAGGPRTTRKITDHAFVSDPELRRDYCAFETSRVPLYPGYQQGAWVGKMCLQPLAEHERVRFRGKDWVRV